MLMKRLVVMELVLCTIISYCRIINLYLPCKFDVFHQFCQDAPPYPLDPVASKLYFFYKVVMGKMVLFQKFQQHKNKLKHLKILIILMFDPMIYWVDMSLSVWMVWSFMSINETFLCAIFIL